MKTGRIGVASFALLQSVLRQPERVKVKKPKKTMLVCKMTEFFSNDRETEQ